MPSPYTTLSPAALPGPRYSFVAKDLATAVLSVWTATGATRSKRDAAAGSGTSVAMKMAGNTRRSFQILAKATGEVTNLDIATTALVDARGNTIAAANIDVYRAHQLQVTTATYQNATAVLAGETLEGLGWYPDALIPTKHPVTGDALAAGKTYQALPLTLPANETHTFLIDVHVPKGTAPSDYTATLTVSADDQDDVEITLSLTVWNFEFPDTAALDTALWKGTADALYSNKTTLGWTATDEQWESDVTTNVNTVLSAGRIAAQPFHVETPLDFKPEPNDDVGPYEVTAEQIAALQSHIDTYHPSTIYLQDPRRYGGPFTANRYSINEVADEYAAWIAAYAAGIVLVDRPDVTMAVYVLDEPDMGSGDDGTESQDVIDWGTPLHDADVGSMVTTLIAVPDQYPGMLSMVSAVNIWCVPMHFWERYLEVDVGGGKLVNGPWTKSGAGERLVAGETLWVYIASSGTASSGTVPYLHIDRPLLNYLLQAWLCRKGGMTGWLYWAAGVKWWQVYDNGNDPWTDPDTYQNWQGSFNGEGSLFYPADEDSIGYYGIVPSMRSIALREGFDDYTLMELAIAAGYQFEVRGEVDALITNFSTWQTDPALYDAARERLGALLSKSTDGPPAAEVFAGGVEAAEVFSGVRAASVFAAGCEASEVCAL